MRLHSQREKCKNVHARLTTHTKESITGPHLTQLSNILPVESFGRYRDDGLAILSGISGPDTERIIKNIRHLFKTNYLKITIEAGMQQTDFLDVTFSADNGKYWP